MSSTINVKTLRNEMGRIIERVRKGEDFTVLYRSRPAFRIVPLSGVFTHGVAEDDSLYRAEADASAYRPPLSSSFANISSALSNRAVPLFIIPSDSAMALRVSAFGTLRSAGKA